MTNRTRTTIFTLMVSSLLIVLGSQATGVASTNTSYTTEALAIVSTQPVEDRVVATRIQEDKRLLELKGQLDNGEISEEDYNYWEKQIVEDLVSRRAAELRDEKLRTLDYILENEGRHIKLALQDLNDEIASYVQAKGLLSSTGPKDTPGWYVLEKLAMDRLETRLAIRLIDSETPEKEDSVLDTVKKSQSGLKELQKQLASLDAEYDSMRANMSTGFADAIYLQHLLDTQRNLNVQQDDNARAQMRVRFMRLTPVGDEELMRKILGE